VGMARPPPRNSRAATDGSYRRGVTGEEEEEEVDIAAAGW